MRVVRSPAAAPGSALVAPELPAGDVARQAALARQALELAQPLRPGERIDVDRASVPELERLPRVGPALARRIVDEREANGPFGSLEGLKRVPGLGPATLKGFERTTTFGGRGSGAWDRGPSPSASQTPDPRPQTPCSTSPISINAATAVELDCLPGIGPGLAERIVTWRTAHGGFREVKELEQVPGLGPVRLRRLVPLVRVP